MRYAVRLTLAIGVVAALILVAGPCAAQKSTPAAPIKFSPLAENVKGGVIDWGTEMMYASGEGAVPPASQEPNRARAFLKAKEYAKMAAIANLLMLIEGTSISYSATGKDFMAQDISLRQTIEGYVKNVQVIRTVQRKEEGGTIVKVTVGTRIYGKDTPGQALLAKLSEVEIADTEPAPVKLEIKGQPPKIVEPQRMPIPSEVEEPESTPAEPTETTEPEPTSVEESKEPEPVTEPEPSREPEPIKETPTTVEAISQPVVKAEPHTSVIIDTLGYRVMRAMAPKIRAKNGDEVWGTFKMDPDEVQDHGPVAYARSLADAKKSPRAGSNPLVLRAIGRAGGSRMCDVVLSDEDIARMKACDQVSKPSFLATKKVIFVVDPVKAF